MTRADDARTARHATTLVVTYRGDPSERFDRVYYVERHLPLVRAIWEPHGLVTAEAYFPASADASFAAVALCDFTSDDALRAALADARSSAIMSDVSNFTDIEPAQSRLAPLARADAGNA